MTDSFKTQLELRIAEFLEKQKAKAPSAEAKLLLTRISLLILRGGKRFRPVLMLKTYNSYGGSSPESLIDLSMALELFHQALLVHDDIIDDDIIRYDGPNIVGYYIKDVKFKDTKIPQSMGILAGDLLLTLSSQIIVDDPSLSSLQKLKILNLINQTMIGVIYGQQLDSINVPSSSEVFAQEKLTLIHSLKSALYTTQLPMRLASIILDLPEDEQNKIDRFALPFGIYFQLVDDYADYFNIHNAFESRPKFRDYPEGKITYPYFAGLEQANPEDSKLLKKYFGDKKISKDTKNKIQDILVVSGADKLSRSFAEQYYLSTVKNLNRLSLSKEHKLEFKEFLDNIKI